MSYDTIDEQYKKAIKKLEELKISYPNLGSKFFCIMTDVIEDFIKTNTNGLKLLDSYLEFSNLRKEYLEEESESNYHNVYLTASKDEIYIQTDLSLLESDMDLQKELNTCEQTKTYLSNLMSICRNVRDQERNFTDAELSGIFHGYSLLEIGSTLDFSKKTIGTSGFRPKHHTFIFTTDPGDDHIRITSRSNALMDGVAVHVEHIDRDQESSKEKVEAYRLPAAINAGKVRLHIGNSAPVTAFIGRPVFENFDKNNSSKPISHKDFQMDKLKSVHMTASACSAMFHNGISDCKIAIERMYLADAIEFMKCVVGNVFRDPETQSLAAAFNLNTPYYDNRSTSEEEATILPLNDPFEIGKMAIEVAKAGGFQRVTWDGASNQIPSKPIIDQLSHEQFTELVHLAHEAGLQTYFSAGLEAEHIARCVYTGVDGLGIGTSLHYIDPDTKLMGAFDVEKIKAVLSERTKAEKTLQGRAAILLARMDRLYYEHNLTDRQNALRAQLYEAVKSQDLPTLKELLEKEELKAIISLPADQDLPVIEQAKRTLQFVERKQDHRTATLLKNAIRHRDYMQLHRLIEN